MSKIENILPFYALGAVTEEERLLVEAAVEQQSEVKSELAKLMHLTESLVHTSEPLIPNPHIKQQLMDRIAQSALDQPVEHVFANAHLRRLTIWERWRTHVQLELMRPLFVTSLILMLVVLVWTMMLQDRLQVAQVQATEVRNMLDALTETNETLQDQNLTQQIALELYSRPSTQFVQLSGTKLQLEAFGQFAFDINSMEHVLWVSGMQSITADVTYQAWYLNDRVAVSAGLFVVDSNGSAIVFLDSAEVPSFDTIGVTIEPAGGSSTPSEQPVMLGSANK
ncbi:MAG: anti-sigma factor domain-containing protein [Candidatus Promineifilaceae bacterium]